MGEFIQSLESYTQITGAALTLDDVDALMLRLLKTMSRNKFFYETDEKAYRKLAIATGCQNLHISSVGEKHKKQAILDELASDNFADYIGDPFIHFLATNLDTVNVRKNYIVFALQAFHMNLWRNNVEQQAICYLEVKGRIDPKALIHIKTPGYCTDQGLAPLISSQICAGQTFVEHTDAVKLFRRELVNLVTKPGDNPQDVLASFNTLAQSNLAKFWDTFTGLPSFTVTFKNANALLD